MKVLAISKPYAYFEVDRQCYSDFWRYASCLHYVPWCSLRLSPIENTWDGHWINLGLKFGVFVDIRNFKPLCMKELVEAYRWTYKMPHSISLFTIALKALHWKCTGWTKNDIFWKRVKWGSWSFWSPEGRNYLETRPLKLSCVDIDQTVWSVRESNCDKIKKQKRTQICDRDQIWYVRSCPQPNH